MLEHKQEDQQDLLLIRRKLDLLLRTGKLLVESLADTNRVVRNMNRVAAYLGLPEDKLHIDVGFTMLQVNLSDNAHSFSKLQKCEHHGVNMTAISEVSKLSWRAIEAVCDDNREFCEKERTTIKDVFKQYFQGEDCQVDIYNDGQTIISNYSDNAYDMVFLDLELGDENGFDIAEQIVLMNNDAIIIFVTSHENLVYEAFRFRPLGYIVKDRFDREFTRMMVKIVDKLIKMRQVIELGGEKFYVDRVVSIATQKRKICVKSLKGEILLADSYSKHVAELEKYGFVQSSKGVLINMKYIKCIDEDNDVFVMYNNERVPISRRRKKDVIEEYRKFMFDNNR